ncbi:STAS domain-containing protein [Streptomyces resistomycificus]|uniref:Anti-sigma factor antagonist n=1 Tax=Streptomyces resistomycificus TaxID=67356 RepID=A0A0L8KZK3_9ACTN|nr:STAS domain-containing protein [Streptomyces resistomycificus]KOG31367.1 hypothetical protein ADK37_30845 [Streptomyces resistomycificus]KUN94280.1 hypothetical protein AQJ84_26675 [Streptomyces resistomycificus]
MADIPDKAGQGTLSVLRDTIDGITVLTVRGEIDFQTVTALQDVLPPADEASGPRMVIDLGEVTFIDSSGINALINAQQALPEQGWLRLARPRPAVRRTLELVGLDSAIPFYPTFEDALT